MGATLLVWPGSPSPNPPYTAWTNAARTIQDAVDAAQAGDRVLVTNGLYATGGRVLYGALTNRLVVDRALIVRSVNGPGVTVIQGYQVPGTANGDGAIRCVYLTSEAVLSGFTLTHGATRGSGDDCLEQSGGGVWCEDTTALVTNCVLAGNGAAQCGGGAYQGTLSNCTLAGNSAEYGGGAFFGALNNCTFTGNLAGYGGGVYGGTLNNCTVAGNSASLFGGGAEDAILNNCTLTGNSVPQTHGSGGGADSSTLNNCVVYYNTGNSGPNYYRSALNYCCTTPVPDGDLGNIAAEPQLASVSHLSSLSPCRGAGSADYVTGVDIDGEAWLSPPSIGCDEYRTGTVTGELTVAIAASWTNLVVRYATDLTGLINGRVAASTWDFGDGTVLSNRPYASHAWGAAGNYAAVLRAYNDSHPEGVSATVTIRVLAQAAYCVSATSTNPVPPYSSWETAAQTIQTAVDATTVLGALVLVNDGVYATGGQVVDGALTNRVAVKKPLVLQSVHGPEVTFIQGYKVPGTNNGDGAVRCVYLVNGAMLSGFTLTNGGTRFSDDNLQGCGGGVWCESTNAVVTNCTLTGNSAATYGGGAYQGTLRKCSLTSNWANLGAGAALCVLNNCALAGNTTGLCGSGGGAYSSTLNNCTLTANWADDGGGVSSCTLSNCTLTGNSGATLGGGAYSSNLKNCILYYNTAGSGLNYYLGQLNYCCTTPLPASGVSNITAEPLFVDRLNGNLRLLSNSPCINAGANAYVSGNTDRDGRPRIVGGTVDIGAYEYQGPALSLFIPWLAQHGLPTDGSADYTDPDGDGADNWQEYLAGSNPLVCDKLRCAVRKYPGSVGFQVEVWGEIGSSYVLQASTNLADWAPVLTFTCTNAPTTVVDPACKNYGRRFYRIAPRSSLPRPELALGSVNPPGSNGLELMLLCCPGSNYRIETSNDLSHWETLTNITSTNASMCFRDNSATNCNRRFYRALVL